MRSVVAMARSLPAWMFGIELPTESNMKSSRPATRSVMPMTWLLYGTPTARIPASAFSFSLARWAELPMATMP